jgi:TRAP-type C4-dicarboxylate transport system substrate-binding protein
MKTIVHRTALAGAAATAALAMAATPSLAGAWGENITAYDKAVEASADAGAWLEGKTPVTTKVTYSGAPITFRYATYIPEVAGYEKVMRQALNQLERMSQNKIKIETYYAQSLHPQAEGFTAVRDGIADWSACFMIYEPTSFNLLHSLTLPFLFTDADAATRTYMELYPKYFKKEYENLGVHLGRGTITPPYNMLGSDKYETLADFKGSKIRVAGRIQIDAIKRLGAVPVSIPSSEAYTSLQRGLVDTVSMNDPAFLIFKLQEISKFHNNVALFTVNLEYCSSPDWFEALPADLKKVFADWAQITNVAVTQAYYEREDRRAKDIFKKAGVTLVAPSAAERASWEKLVAGVTTDWVASNEKARRPAKQLLADIKSTLARHEKMSWNASFADIQANPVKGYIDY